MKHFVKEKKPSLKKTPDIQPLQIQMESRDITRSLSYYFISNNIDENKLEQLIFSQMMEEELTNQSVNHHEEQVISQPVDNNCNPGINFSSVEGNNTTHSSEVFQTTEYAEQPMPSYRSIVMDSNNFNDDKEENAPITPQQQHGLSEDYESTIRNSITARSTEGVEERIIINNHSLMGGGSREYTESNQEKTGQHLMQRKIEPIITESGLSPSSPSLNSASLKFKEEICSPTISSSRVEDFQFTVVEIQTTVNDVKPPSSLSNCFYFMRKCSQKVDKILMCIIVSTLIISCVLLSFPIPLISVGTYYLQSSKYDSSSDSDANSLIFTRFPCFVVGRSRCNSDGDLQGVYFKISFPSYLRDGSEQNSTTPTSNSSKTRTLLTSTCYSYSNQYAEGKEYICYTNRDESKVSLSEPSSQTSNYYTNVGFQLLLFGVIGLIASVCIVVSVCCTSWILIEHKPWSSSSSLTSQDQVIKEANSEAQVKEKTETV